MKTYTAVKTGRTSDSVIIRRICALKAQMMQASLGTRVAAGYLRNRGLSLEFALATLCAKRVA